MNVPILDYIDGYVGRIKQGEEGYDMNEVRETYLARIKNEGMRAVMPLKNQLQIDIDSKEQYAVFLKAIEVILRNWSDGTDIVISDVPSSSGAPHRHITLTLPFDVSDWQRIALQAALGSDPIRELLSATRLIRGDAHPTLFVEKIT